MPMPEIRSTTKKIFERVSDNDQICPLPTASVCSYYGRLFCWCNYSGAPGAAESKKNDEDNNLSLKLMAIYSGFKAPWELLQLLVAVLPYWSMSKLYM